MTLLLLDERYPRELLAGFEVVTAPQEDVVAVLTMPEHPVGLELCARMPALRVVGTATAEERSYRICVARVREVLGL